MSRILHDAFDTSGLTGIIAAESNQTGSLTILKEFAGAVTAETIIIGKLTIGIRGNLVATANSTANLNKIILLSGTITAVSVVKGKSKYLASFSFSGDTAAVSAPPCYAY